MPSIQLTCPHCGSTLNFNQTVQAGAVLPCLICNRTFSVAPATAAAAVPAAPQHASPAAPAQVAAAARAPARAARPTSQPAAAPHAVSAASVAAAGNGKRVAQPPTTVAGRKAPAAT